MTINSEQSSRYAKNLFGVIKSWAKYRKSKNRNDLEQFHGNCSQILDDFSDFNLPALKQALTRIGSICEQFLLGEMDEKQTIKEVDWLVNQLIRGSKESTDPFLHQTTRLNYLISNKTDPFSSKINGDRTRQPVIVVIDSQKSVGIALTNTLKDFAFDSYYFQNIEAFKRSKCASKVDLVLLDIVMPKHSQEDVFSFAKQLEESDINVICCSSNFDFDVRLLAVRAKVSDYIVKPVNTYVLVEKIGRVLGLQYHKKYHVVIVDDQETMGAFYKAVLEQVGCDVTYFSDPVDLFNNLEDSRPDMFLLDLIMPDVDGLEVAQMIRQEHKFDFAPILFITADDTLDNRLQAIDVGADDVILKTESVPSITRQILTRLDRASKVRAFVAKDPLTGVLNHGQIVEESNNFIRSIHRRNSIAALAVIDVDRFKSVNDSYGHLMGDRVLSALGQMLSNSVRESDKVGRYGGEEFILIFEDCTVDDAKLKVEKIKAKFSALSFKHEHSQFNVSFSAGLVDLKQFHSLQSAINIADKALYQAKNTGRNKVVAFCLNDIKKLNIK